MATTDTEAFERALQGPLTSLMGWDDLAAFWQRLPADGGWYLYAVGEPAPSEPTGAAGVHEFIARVDALLRREHEEDYCGIVYADDLDRPTLIKIYDPNNLGVVCGSGSAPVLPGWVMSRLPPHDLKASTTASRRRWWQAFLGRAAP